MLEQLTKIIMQYTENDDFVITEDTSIAGSLGLNSLDLVNIVMAAEDEFGIEIPDKALRNFRTVGDVLSFIESSKK